MLFLSFPVVHVDAHIYCLVATALGHSSCTGSMETCYLSLLVVKWRQWGGGGGNSSPGD